MYIIVHIKWKYLLSSAYTTWMRHKTHTHDMWNVQYCGGYHMTVYSLYQQMRVSCEKGPTRHAYTWQIGPFWAGYPQNVWALSNIRGAFQEPCTLYMPHCVELLFALALVNKSGIIDWKVIHGYLLMKGNVMNKQRQQLQLNGVEWCIKCISKLTIIGSDNGLSPGWCKAIIWTNAGILLSGPWGINSNEILIKNLFIHFH